MALFVNQGKQDTTQDNKFNPIVAPDVLLEITELKLAKTQDNTLEVTLRVLEGQYKNRFVFDRVTFDPTSPMSWKYRQLRKCAGVPYQDNEPASIDIEALLLHKAVKADLGIRKGKNKDGVEQDYQDVKYKVAKVAPTPQPLVGSAFAQAPAPQPTPAEAQPVVKKTAKKTKQVEPVVQHDTFEEPAPLPTQEPQGISITDDSDWD